MTYPVFNERRYRQAEQILKDCPKVKEYFERVFAIDRTERVAFVVSKTSPRYKQGTEPQTEEDLIIAQRLKEGHIERTVLTFQTLEDPDEIRHTTGHVLGFARAFINPQDHQADRERLEETARVKLTESFYDYLTED